MISISVAMATFNGAKFLPEQLESIRQQTLPPHELVVTDDGSTDDTISVLERFAATSPFPVRILRNSTRMGYRANFMHNFGLHDFEAIAVCDQDDIWHTRKLEIAAQSLADPDVTLFCHDAWLVNNQGTEIGGANIITLPPINPPLSFYPLINPLGFAIVFRRTLLALSELWPLSADTWEAGNRMAHDQWLSFLASSLGTIVFSDEKLVRYRQHANNTYGWKKQSFLARYAYKLRNPGPTLRVQSDAATARARILESAAADLQGTWRVRSLEAAQKYRAFSNLLAVRSEVYEGNTLSKRVAALRTLLKSGAYTRGTPWDLSRTSFGKDLLLGTALRHLLTEATRDDGKSVQRADLKLG